MKREISLHDLSSIYPSNQTTPPKPILFSTLHGSTRNGNLGTFSTSCAESYVPALVVPSASLPLFASFRVHAPNPTNAFLSVCSSFPFLDGLEARFTSERSRLEAFENREVFLKKKIPGTDHDVCLPGHKQAGKVEYPG